MNTTRISGRASGVTVYKWLRSTSSILNTELLASVPQTSNSAVVAGDLRTRLHYKLESLFVFARYSIGDTPNDVY